MQSKILIQLVDIYAVCVSVEIVSQNNIIKITVMISEKIQ